MESGKRSFVDLSLAADPVDEGRRNVAQRAPDPDSGEAKPVEHGARHRAAEAIRELIERSPLAKPREGAGQDCKNLLRPHGEQRQAADRRTRGHGAEPRDARRIRAGDLRLREALLQQRREFHPHFDEDDVLLRNTAPQQRPREDARSGPKLDDPAGLRPDLPHDEIRQCLAGRRDRGDPQRIAAVRAAVPDAELIVDANEGWTDANIVENLAAAAGLGIALIDVG